MKLGVFFLAIAAFAADVPQADITNGLVKAKLYLPDAERGYYRGTRFDWSGVIASLEYKGHSYFGQWFEKYDPKLHDAIMGPVEEFRTNDSGLGWDQAKPGETFIKIGVGVLRKNNDPEYKFASTLDIVDGGKWTSHAYPDRVEFTQVLTDASGYAYEYHKTVRLTKGKPQLVIEHQLKNTGKRGFETAVYDHNFFVIDGEPSGPEFQVKFPFDVKPVADVADKVAIQGGEMTYVRNLEKGQSVYTELKGYGATAKDYDIRVENRKTKAGVHVTGDQPLSKLVFWSIRTTLCPEAYVSHSVEPGKTWAWRITYDFY